MKQLLEAIKAKYLCLHDWEVLHKTEYNKYVFPADLSINSFNFLPAASIWSLIGFILADIGFNIPL